MPPAPARRTSRLRARVTDPISYASDNETRRQARPTRTAGTWAKLFIVWGAGLIVWAFYIAVILYVFFGVIL